MLYRSTHPQPPPVALGVLQYDQYGLVAKQTHGCALAGVYNGFDLETTWKRPQAMRPSATSRPYSNLCVMLAAKPAEFLVLAPMKFELVIILKTAKQIGVTNAPEVLARASRLIK